MSNVELVADHARDVLGDPAQYRGGDGYRQSLALCMIDSVFSLRAHYSSVIRTVERYRANRGDLAEHDGASELIASIQKLGVEEWSTKIGTRHRAAGAGRPRKTAVLLDAATRLVNAGVDTIEQFRSAVARNNAGVRDLWLGVPGLGKASWHYLLILTGAEDVKADVMVCRFVADALGVPESQIAPDQAHELVTAAAKELGVGPSALDHTIWNFQSGRTAEISREAAEEG